MLTDSVTSTVSDCPPADVTDDSCRLQFSEIVPLTRDTDGPCTTDVKQQNLTVEKQNCDDVCCNVLYNVCYQHVTALAICAHKS